MLSRAEVVLLAQAALMLPLTAQGLRWLGFRRWLAALTRWVKGPNRSGDDYESLAEAETAAKMVAMASRALPFSTTCLHRSLVLWSLLHRRGIDGDLRLGVRKEAGSLRAHACVEHLGHALNEGEDVHQQFAAFEQEIHSAVLSLDMFT
jgi:hypothetical protein